MMIEPSGYIEEHKNDSFEQLIAEKNALVAEINELEKIAFDKTKSDPAWGIHPGPDVLYQTDLEYLAELCNFIKDKYNSEIIWGNIDD